MTWYSLYPIWANSTVLLKVRARVPNYSMQHSNKDPIVLKNKYEIPENIA
jgi:hypothetical protein